MPPKSKRSSKKADQTGDCSPWLNRFCSKHDIPAALVEVLAEHHVTSESILAGITEQDLSNMRLVVGHKIILRRVIATLNKPSDLSTDLTPSLLGSTSPEVSLQPFKLADELAKIEAEFNESTTAPPATPSDSQHFNSAEQVQADAQAVSTSSESTGSEGKPLLPSDLIYGPDGKQLKPLQLTFAQFMLANFKILESLMSKKPGEASDYLKFLAIKGTRFQTKAILAFDQDYRATKTRDNFCWGTNVDDLSAQYFDAAVALRPTPSLSTRITSTDARKSANHQPVTDEFCFRWNFSPNGCPNPQSCRYKHVCIHCSQQHKGKSCPGATGSSTQKQ